ncbi:unnamed protein product [Phytomonas sp. EM1]|nr:unnamed protein product [Phytomonas sp. EM1]|eukprot:CCW63901.1 unnamed protein product [Phytomonas sp. isolate EM1]
MKRQRNSDLKRLGPAAPAMRRSHVFRDARQAETQIKAEKLIQDAVDMQRFYSPGGGNSSTARLTIYSNEELAIYRQKTRSELEERVKRGYTFVGNWIKYARWEAQQKDFERMRAVLQRAIVVQGENPNFWRDYAELEASNGFVQQAREVYSRAVNILPLSTDLWLKYLIFEQAAGEDGNVRDVFNRWVSGESPSDCAFELYALFEAQCGHCEACRDVLRRYVEARNTPEAWILFGQVERYVFGDGRRAIRTLQTALEALPDEFLWGPAQCRVPLFLAEVMVEESQISEARAMYQTLLRNLCCDDRRGDRGGSLADLVLSAYSSFERLHGDRENCEALSRFSAKHLYERRLKDDPEDISARISLYLLLREEEEEGEAGSGMADRSNSLALATTPPAAAALTSSPKPNTTSMQCLKGVLRTAATQPDRAQQRAVLLMEYARRAEAGGQMKTARQALMKGIAEFPFEEATCTRLWLEAAAFEERQGEFDRARRLLKDAAAVCHDPTIFSSSIRLEHRALERGAVAGHAEYLTRVRRIYQDALRAFPTHEELWFGFAKMEEKEGQVAKSHALYSACAKMLTAEAAKTKSYAERYALLGRVDRAWAHRIALQTRLIKRLQAAVKSAEAASMPLSEVDDLAGRLRKARSDLHEVYLALLDSVWRDYTYEAVAWKGTYEQQQPLDNQGERHAGVMGMDGGAPGEDSRALVPPPPSLPDTLAPAMARWSDAVSAVKGFFVSKEGGDAFPVEQPEGHLDGPSNVQTHQHNSHLLLMRDLFKSMIAKQRDVLRCTLGYTKLTGFDAGELINKWVELLLSPLLHEWSAFEALEGGSLAAVKEHVSAPVKRRRRLFVK